MEGQVTGMYQAGGSTKGVASHVLQKSQERFPNIADWPSLEDLIEERKKAKKELFDRAFPPQSSTSRIAKNLLIAPVWEFAVAAKRTGHTVGLVTTTEREWVERYLAASDVRGPGNAPMTQPEQFFDVVVCGKKKGEGVRDAICQVLGKADFSDVPFDELRNFLVVEDSLEGTQEAKSVGVRVLTVPNDFTQASFPDLLLSQQAIENLSFADVIALLT